MKRYLPVSEGKRLNICVFACISTQKTVSLHDVNNKLKEENDSEEFKRKYRTLMNAPVFVDSPLAISATEVFKENMNLFL